MKKPVPFGKYFLMDRIAVGGMAEVFKAKTFGVEGFEKNVALKRILPNIAEDQEFITMFIDEAKIAVQLSHANIAQIFELGEDQGSYFIAMEFVAGKDLRTMFDRSRRQGGIPIAPSQAAFIMARVCEGLDYAHRKRDNDGNPLNIVHRDISPQNVIVSYEGHVKVIDFGVAKAQNKMGRTQAGILKGKFGYMSPEQVRGLPLDQRSDIFSLGIVLHEILTGNRLFIGESDFHTLEKIRKAEAAPPSQLNPQVPPRLDAIVMKALAREYEERYQYASEMQEDLQRFLYTQSPVYAAKDLGQYMKQVFGQDMLKEKKRTSEYEDYFANNPNGIVAETPSNGWGAPSQQVPTSYVGETPATQFPHQQTSSHSSHSGAHPVNPPAPAYAAPAPGGGSPYGANALYDNSNDDDDPTMLGQDIHDKLPPPPGGHLLSGDQLPGAAPERFNLEPPIAQHAPSYDPGGEQDTIIDIGEIKENKTPYLKIVFLGALFAFLLGGLGYGGVVIWSKLSGGQKVHIPPPEEPGKLTLRFGTSTKDLRFSLNNQPIAPENISVLPQKAIILIKKEGTYSLRIAKPGHKGIVRSFFISPGSELSTRIRLIPLVGFIALESKPKGAVVFIDGDRQKQPTPSIFKVFAGKRQIRVLMQGREPWEQTVLLKQNQRLSFKMKMGRTRPSIQVLCREGGEATVFLNGKKRGLVKQGTPWKKKYLRLSKTYQLKVVPKGYDKIFTKEVGFPLDPHPKFIVDCKLPKQAEFGTVKINSTPPARISIKGRFYGETPKTLRLRVGNYKITLENTENKKRLLFPISIKSGPNDGLTILRNNYRNAN